MFQKHMSASVHNRTWMSQQNNKKTSSQGLSPAALRYKFQEPRKLQEKDHNKNWIIWKININWAGNDFRWSKKKTCYEHTIFSVIQGTKTLRYNLLHYLLPHNFNSFFHCTTSWNQRSQKQLKYLSIFWGILPTQW